MILFKNKNIMIIGDVMLDTYLFGNVERISPEAPVPIVDITIKQDKLGGAANVAANIKGLGGTPILCTVIGNDQKGKILCDLLKKQRITSENIIKSNNRITTNKTRIVGNNHQMLRVDEEIKTVIGNGDTKQLIENIEKILDNESIDTILFQDYDKGVISEVLINKVTKKAKELNIPIIADPKKLNFDCYKNIKLFKPNFKEFKDGINLIISDINNNETKYRKELLEKGSVILHQRGIEIVFVTLAENGIFMSYKNTDGGYTNKIIHGTPRDVSDVSGAGDTVMAVVSMLIGDLPIETVAKISNIAGGIVCEDIGVVTIDKERLINEINL